MKTFFCILFLQLSFVIVNAQTVPDKRFSAAQLKEDLAFLKTQITRVHAMPYSELSEKQYDKLFSEIESKLKDSLTATDFIKLVKPVIAYLSDEHAQLNLKKELHAATFGNGSVCIPFSLVQKGNDYVTEEILAGNSSIGKGVKVTAVNNIPVADWISKCALQTSGFPGQRVEAALAQFGYLFAFANTTYDSSFTISTTANKTIVVKGITITAWRDYFNRNADHADCEERITYQRFGNTGYINACSFDVGGNGPNSMTAVRSKIDSIFKLIHNDNVKNLVIDVSSNGGGNSAVGDYMIAYFYAKPYQDYQYTWKRSDEYLKLLESWGLKDERYAATPVGQTIYGAPETVTPQAMPLFFTGKVTVVVGKGTFSSAMLFATLIKDNHIATLIGEVPRHGHPNHFGEMYNNNFPNTRIQVSFGVKEWIRPAGKKKGQDNLLHPDIVLTPAEMMNAESIVKKVQSL
ncbi:MAG: S41 family peptidase [Chitinophagaceae bacterium]